MQTVSQEIRSILTERAASFNIALDDVSITSLNFGKEYAASIEAKQIAAQEAERARFVVEKAEQEKKSAIIRAQVIQLLQLLEHCLFNIFPSSLSSSCPISFLSLCTQN